MDYLRDGQAIYSRSFAMIRAEADLTRFAADQVDVVVRMIHACGLVALASDVIIQSDLVRAARAALQAGAPIFCDAEMVAHGITRSRLPRNNDVVCTLREASVAERAQKLGTTRSAAAPRWQR